MPTLAVNRVLCPYTYMITGVLCHLLYNLVLQLLFLASYVCDELVQQESHPYMGGGGGQQSLGEIGIGAAT